MTQENIEFGAIRNQLIYLVSKCSGMLGNEAIEAVQHLIAHDEYEMAFEGLFIELMNLGYKFDDADISGVMATARALSLDKESVYDKYFWARLLGYLGEK